MSTDPFDREAWERRWSQALREHGDAVAQRPPNEYLLDVAGDLAPGRALDSGCGHGAEATWLAATDWQVMAVDFSATADLPLEAVAPPRPSWGTSPVHSDPAPDNGAAPEARHPVSSARTRALDGGGGSGPR